jgi:hypothetical protein
MRKSALASLALMPALSACLTHVPMHTRGHLDIDWRPTYAAAQADAIRLGKPILTVMIAGDKRGPSCLGGDYLRSVALNDPEVVKVVNERFVPVWINIRTQPVPDWPFVDQVLVTAKLDDRHRVRDLFSRSFFIRTVIASPDGQTLLNPGAATVAETARRLVFEGDFSYERIDAGDYLSMLGKALERHAARRIATAL